MLSRFINHRLAIALTPFFLGCACCSPSHIHPSFDVEIGFFNWPVTEIQGQQFAEKEQRGRDLAEGRNHSTVLLVCAVVAAVFAFLSFIVVLVRAPYNKLIEKIERLEKTVQEVTVRQTVDQTVKSALSDYEKYLTSKAIEKVKSEGQGNLDNNKPRDYTMKLFREEGSEVEATAHSGTF